MATDGQFSWPSVGSSVAAYGQFFMAANICVHRQRRRDLACMSISPRVSSDVPAAFK